MKIRIKIITKIKNNKQQLIIPKQTYDLKTKQTSTLQIWSLICKHYVRTKRCLKEDQHWTSIDQSVSRAVPRTRPLAWLHAECKQRTGRTNSAERRRNRNGG